MTSAHLPPAPGPWSSRLAAALARRSAPRLARLSLGAILARGRRTVPPGTRAAPRSDPFRPGSPAVAAAGTRADRVAARRAPEAVKPRVADAGGLTRARDDTPTERSGPHVPGAGIPHNPTPGPAGSPSVSGPVVVVLGRLVAPEAWGPIARPRLARLDARKKDRPGIDPKPRPPLRTPREWAVAWLRGAATGRGLLKEPLWVAADGACAQAASLKPELGWGMTGVSRRRTDATRRAVPGPRPPGRRGRPRVSGGHRIDPAERAGQRRRGTSGGFDRDGEPTVKRDKTSLATWRPADGVIRVVLGDEPAGWVASFCTEASASVADILRTVADRFSGETASRDGPGIVGAGQQQVRYVGADVGAFHVGLGTFTRTEGWAWDREAGTMVDRSAAPWDDPARRPSQADKRRAWRLARRRGAIRAVLRPGVTDTEIQAAAERPLNRAA